MNYQRYSPEFKDEAVRQVVDRGYSFTEVADRPDLFAHSLYQWVKVVNPGNLDEQTAVSCSHNVGWKMSGNPAYTFGDDLLTAERGAQSNGPCT